MRYYPCLNFPSNLVCGVASPKKSPKMHVPSHDGFVVQKCEGCEDCAAMAEKRGAVFVYVVYIIFILYRYYLYIYMYVCMFIFIYIIYPVASITYISHQNLPDVGKYTSLMDARGYCISKYTYPHRNFPWFSHTPQKGTLWNTQDFVECQPMVLNFARMLWLEAICPWYHSWKLMAIH